METIQPTEHKGEHATIKSKVVLLTIHAFHPVRFELLILRKQLSDISILRKLLLGIRSSFKSRPAVRLLGLLMAPSLATQ